MSQAKVELFTNDQQDLAQLFKALGHPARIQILNYLANCNTCVTGDITEEIPLSRTTVNQHLTELKKADLIQGTLEGAKTNYCLNTERIEQLKENSNGFFADLLKSRFGCC